MKAKLKAKYLLEDEYDVELSYYVGSVPALVIMKDGQMQMKASVNLERFPIPNAIFIKNWSENEGIQLALEQAGLISPPIAHYATGHVEATEHMMIGELLKEYQS